MGLFSMKLKAWRQNSKINRTSTLYIMLAGIKSMIKQQQLLHSLILIKSSITAGMNGYLRTVCWSTMIKPSRNRRNCSRLTKQHRNDKPCSSSSVHILTCFWIVGKERNRSKGSLPQLANLLPAGQSLPKVEATYLMPTHLEKKLTADHLHLPFKVKLCLVTLFVILFELIYHDIHLCYHLPSLCCKLLIFYSCTNKQRSHPKDRILP